METFGHRLAALASEVAVCPATCVIHFAEGADAHRAVSKGTGKRLARTNSSNTNAYPWPEGGAGPCEALLFFDTICLGQHSSQSNLHHQAPIGCQLEMIRPNF